MRRLVPILALLVAVAAQVAPAATAAGRPPKPRIELAGLRPGTEVEEIAVGAEGYLWFGGVNRAEDPGNVVGRISPTGAVDEYQVPGTASVLGVGGLARGPEGNMWFTEPSADRIERVPPTGGPEGFTVPTPGSEPTGIVGAPGGFLWVTMAGTGKIARVDPQGRADVYSLNAGARPTAIALGSDGALWSIEENTPIVARTTLQGMSTSFPLPTNGAAFEGTVDSDITTGPDGNLWLSQSDGPFIGEVVPTATEPEYHRYGLPLLEGEGTTLISRGPGGDLWFAAGGVIGSISPDGKSIGDPACALPGCTPISALSEGPEGELWFAAGEKIGTFSPPRLFLVSHESLKVPRPRLGLSLECRGGAAGERCKGVLEVLRGGFPVARGHFAIPTMTRRRVRLHLVDARGRRAAAKRRLPARYVARLASRPVPIYAAGS